MGSEKMDKKILATLYTKGIFGVHAIRINLLDHGTMSYAQYEAAPFVTFIEKGKRTQRRLCDGFRPFFLIVEGHDAPTPEDWLVKKDEMSSVSKYGSYDERYITDFNVQINPLIASGKVKVIADYRYNKTTEVSE
jgi:hypothetical protein